MVLQHVVTHPEGVGSTHMLRIIPNILSPTTNLCWQVVTNMGQLMDRHLLASVKVPQ